ncbi:ATP-binding protein [Aureimonas sp. AU12]|uniref:sensor histidine kinase n=1 Tax=Aureimonas sp. AU12 TaxID=1638161 RepID=UPI0007866645|nr:sensor histidine kinase [Aureimonas sp. AU12]
MKRNLSIRNFRRFAVGAITAGFAVLLVVGAATVWLVVRTQDNAGLVAHSLRVELSLANLRALSERAETARRGFLLAPDERFTTIFNEVANRIPSAITELDALVADNPAQTARLAQLTALSNEHLSNLRQSMDARRNAASAADVPFAYDRTTQLIPAIRELADEISAQERLLLDDRIRRQERSIEASYAVIGLAALLLAAVAGGTIWATRRNMRELSRASDRLMRLNDDLEGAVEIRTAELQRANDEIQRFAYIVSHDLRSPLVNVMGFTSELETVTGTLAGLIERAEVQAPGLVDEEVRLAVREDLPEAIGFIRTSTQKMDRLINAILRLSREGRRVIVPEPLDMEALVGGIVQTLQHRLSEIGATIEIEPMPAVVSDRVAVEQIFSNLVENAVKYLKPGRPGVIKVRGRREGARAVFEIEDNGRGIDPKDHDRVFDLFRRSGQQDQPGEGIGLAHVRALVYRLGGVIDCRSALDAGATFRLSMQADLAAPEGARAT